MLHELIHKIIQNMFQLFLGIFYATNRNIITTKTDIAFYQKKTTFDNKLTLNVNFENKIIISSCSSYHNSVKISFKLIRLNFLIH